MSYLVDPEGRELLRNYSELKERVLLRLSNVLSASFFDTRWAFLPLASLQNEERLRNERLDIGEIVSNTVLTAIDVISCMVMISILIVNFIPSSFLPPETAHIHGIPIPFVRIIAEALFIVIGSIFLHISLSFVFRLIAIIAFGMWGLLLVKLQSRLLIATYHVIEDLYYKVAYPASCGLIVWLTVLHRSLSNEAVGSVIANVPILKVIILYVIACVILPIRGLWYFLMKVVIREFRLFFVFVFVLWVRNTTFGLRFFVAGQLYPLKWDNPPAILQQNIDKLSEALGAPSSYIRKILWFGGWAYYLLGIGMALFYTPSVANTLNLHIPLFSANQLLVSEALLFVGGFIGELILYQCAVIAIAVVFAIISLLFDASVIIAKANAFRAGATLEAPPPPTRTLMIASSILTFFIPILVTGVAIYYYVEHYTFDHHLVGTGLVLTLAIKVLITEIIPHLLGFALPLIAAFFAIFIGGGRVPNEKA